MITIGEINAICDEYCTCAHPDFWSRCPACEIKESIAKRIDENFAEDTAERIEHFERGRK